MFGLAGLGFLLQNSTNLDLVAMDVSRESDEFFDVRKGRFQTTQWSVVLAANQEDDAERFQALEELCRTYWYPVYAFIRRQGYEAHDAQDLAQGFFAHLLERETINAARSDKGRFRSFLLGALKNFLGYEARKQATIKRGGKAVLVSIDAEECEERYGHDLPSVTAPDQLYLRAWADSLLNSALGLLRRDYIQAGKERLLEGLLPYLASGEHEGSYRELATTLDLSVGAVTMSVHRMRKRYGELLREQIAQTVGTPAEIDEELSFLLSVLET